MGRTTSERLAFIVTMNPDQAIRAFEQTGKSADKHLGKAEDRIDQIGGKMTRFGAVALASTGIVARGLFSLGESAGTSQAAIAANTQVLGEASQAVQDWAEDSVEAAGISERAAIEATTSFGQLAKKAGLAGEDVSGFSTNLVELAADLGAFADVDPTQVIEDLQSGFAGSTEVLRKYGIFLTEADLKAAVFRETGEQVNGTLSTQQRIIAINSELYRQSADAQGQWARESGELLGQQAQLTAELDNLQAAIGAGVLPVLTDVTGAAVSAAGAFGDLDPAVQSGVGTMATYATIATGVVGGLSLIGGQAIKARDNLTTVGSDGTRSLNKLGKAAAGAGAALTAVATVEIAKGALNQAFGVFDRQTEALESLQATLGATETTYEDAVDSFARQTDALDDELRGFIGLGGVYDNFARRQISLIGDQEASLDTYGKALREVFDQSPAQARQIVDALIEQRDALKGAGENVDDLSLLIGTLNPKLNEWEAASSAVADANSDVGDSAADAAGDVEGLGDSASDTAREIKSLEDRLTGLYRELDDSDALIDVEQGFADIRDRTEEWVAAITEGGPEAEQALRDQQSAQNDLTRTVGEYLNKLGLVPTEVATDVAALIDEGDYTAAEARLTELSRRREVIINVATSGYDPGNVLGGSPEPVPDTRRRAGGGQVLAGNRYLVGEEGPEIVEFERSGNVYSNGDRSPRNGDNAYGMPIEQLEAYLSRPTIQVNVEGVGNDQVGRIIADRIAQTQALNGEWIFLGDLAAA